MKNLKQIPEIGKFYHFWDDGKVSMSRHYICKVENIIKPEDAKNIIVKVPEWNFDNKKIIFNDISLYDHWLNEKLNCDWLFDDNTDYFIEVSCPNYDNNNLWFVRTKNGGWFSMDIQSSWQGGRLDVTGEIYDNIIKEYKDDGCDVSGYEEAKYEKMYI